MADIAKTIKNFERKGFNVSYFPTSVEAVEYLGNTIQKTTVGIGGSITVREIGLHLELEKTNSVIFPMGDFGNTSPDKVNLANQAKVYISGVNGISEDGEMIIIDGIGNRVSAGAYGAEKVFFISGVNKIESDLKNAMYRARNIAGPLNARRLNLSTPCTFGDVKCHDCNSKDRICNIFAVYEKPLMRKYTEIILIGEVLGF